MTIICKERVYVDDKGKRVDEGFKGPRRLAAVPGEELTDERAAALGVKELKGAENKAAEPAGTKGGFSFTRGKG